MEGIAILGIVVGFFVVLGLSMRQRARAGYPPMRRSSGRRDHLGGLSDADFETILEESRTRRP
jgi:hypothetical protein